MTVLVVAAAPLFFAHNLKICNSASLACAAEREKDHQKARGRKGKKKSVCRAVWRGDDQLTTHFRLRERPRGEGGGKGGGGERGAEEEE